MSVDILCGECSDEIGTPSFFFAFFSTIVIRLESGKWGSRFPVIMNELYGGRVPPEQAAAARLELQTIRQELRKFSPAEVVWNSENLSERPPWGDKIAPDIHDLSTYFVTSRGKDLIDLLLGTFAFSQSHNVPAEIR